MGADEERLMARNRRGMTIPAAWARLTTSDHAALARSVAGDEAEGLLLAAVWLTAADRLEEAEEFFNQAAARDAEAVRAAKRALNLVKG